MKKTLEEAGKKMLDSKISSKKTNGRRVNRVKRVPISIRNVLKWDNQDPSYQYRWVNDNEDRVPRFKEAGWETVESKEHAGGNRSTGDPSKLASYVEKSVGSGTKAVLMRINKEDYEEDQKTKQEEVDEIERSMDPRYREGGLLEGKIEIDR